MAEIFPFEGIHYNGSRVSPQAVIAPPYDVISPEEQDRLYQQSPANFVRLILNRELAADDGPGARYARSAQFLHEALASGILVQDAEPALYEYIQTFRHPNEPGTMVERTSLFVALKLEPYENGVVLPHEETHSKAKQDRLLLMRATHANPEPIYGLYEDPTQSVARLLKENRVERSPLISACLTEGPNQGDRHDIYRHAGSDLIESVRRFFADRRVWIADGHHRYETALNYQKERREAQTGRVALDAYDSILIGLSAFEDPGLLVLPTHRLVRNISMDRIQALEASLSDHFEVTSLDRDNGRTWISRQVPAETRFLLVLKDRTLALRLKREAESPAAAEGHCDAWGRLDVTRLQILVLDAAFGISWRDLARTSDVAYTRDESDALARVDSGEFQVACLLQNPTVDEVRDVAAAGDKMPQKSTFFYPKLWSGLIMRLLD